MGRKKANKSLQRTLNSSVRRAENVMLKDVRPGKLILINCIIATIVLPLIGYLLMQLTDSFIGGIDVSTHDGAETALDPMWFWPLISAFILVTYAIPAALLFVLLRHRSASARNWTSVISLFVYLVIVTVFVLSQRA